LYLYNRDCVVYMKLKLVSNKVQMSLNLEMYDLENWKSRLKLAFKEPTKQIFISKLRLKVLLKGKIDQHWHKFDIETIIKLITS